MNAPIDISPGDLETVREILARHVPEHEVLAFGSRVNWTARQYSDLDLAVMTEKPLDISRISDLCEAFTQSDLPFKVDIADWADTAENFRKIIEEEHAIVQQRRDQHKLDGWQKFTIGEIAEIVGGGTPSTKKPENFDGNIPWITPKDLSGPHDRYIGRGKRNLSKKGLENSSAKLLPSGSILLSTRAPIGYVALAKNPIATNQGFRSLVVKEGFSQEYLYYWLIRNTEELKRHASGSTFQELSGSTLKTISLYLPQLPEQHAIAHILGTLDDKIELNRQMSETLEAMARALFKSWFVDFYPVRAKMEGHWRRGESLPGLPADLWDFFPSRFIDSKLGQIPDGWKVATFNDVAEQLREQENPISSPNTLFSHFSIPAFDNGQTPKPEYGKDIKSIKLEVLPETVLLSKLNPEIERVWLVGADIGEKAVCSTEFLVLRACSPFTRNYVYCLLCSPLFQKEIKALVTGTSKSHQRVHADAVLSLDAISPPESIIEAFDLIASKFLNRVLSCRSEINSIGPLRDTLLPRLISGELKIL